MYVPPGEFLIGSTTADDPDDLLREISLDGFFIGKYELTCQDYKRFIEDLAKTDPKKAQSHIPRGRARYWTVKDGKVIRTPRVVAPLDGQNYPIHSVSFRDAQAYCKWRTDKEKVRYRLPTPAEWEKAARGVDGRLYPWGNHFDPVLCNMCHSKKTCHVEPVGSFPHDCSPYGAMDMAGNQHELCSDPKAKPGWCMGKGGTFHDTASRCRCSYKEPQDATAWFTGFSFRVLKETPAKDGSPTDSAK